MASLLCVRITNFLVAYQGILKEMNPLSPSGRGLACRQAGVRGREEENSLFANVRFLGYVSKLCLSKLCRGLDIFIFIK